MARYEIRFRVNLTGGEKSRKSSLAKGNDFARVVVHNAAIVYADKAYENLKGQVAASVERAVQDEVKHIAKLYARLIPGRSNAIRSDAQLTTFARDVNSTRAGSEKPVLDSRPLKGSFPAWAPLNAQYVQRKARQGKQSGFFAYEGLLAKELGGTDWTTYFGPIRVRVVRTNTQAYSSEAAKGVSFYKRNGFDSISYARVSVALFGDVTADMLEGGDRGLVGLVSAKNKELAHHLAPQTEAGNTPYRSSLEPFVQFAINRSLPAAVHARLTSRR